VPRKYRGERGEKTPKGGHEDRITVIEMIRDKILRKFASERGKGE
jgi:hypothetical protein